jgi:hypothetical protein|tara:strand:+ start:72 stop:239 length:168 start_codon:yes stop_codon:yes gene_type:complete
VYLFAGFPEVEVSGKRDEKSETGNIHDVQITPTDTLLAIIAKAVQIVSTFETIPY